MVFCNTMIFEATVQWRSHRATARSTSATEAKNRALENAINKGRQRGERYDPNSSLREWYVVKLTRFGRGTTFGFTYAP